MRRILSLALLCLSATPLAQTVAIKAGRVIDPGSGSVIENRVIVVNGGKITSIGNAVPEGAKVIDMSGKSVLPGLFDVHTHLCMSMKPGRDSSYYTTTLLESTVDRALEGTMSARQMLHAGFTFCRDVGNEGDYATTALKRAIQRGYVEGPTIMNAGRIIAPFGGQFQVHPEKRHLAEPEYFFADTRDEMTKAIRENIHFGADLIKIVVDDQEYIYSAEDITFMVAEAGKAGRKVAAHCWTDAGARNAIAAGVASIEHGYGMTDETRKLAQQKGVFLVGTEFPVEANMIFTQNLEAAKRSTAHWVANLKSAYQLGVPLAFGSDSIFRVPNMGWGETTMLWLQSWKDAGVTPMDTLKAMTSNAAKLCGVDHRKGALKIGYDADIIAVEGDPTKDIFALRKNVFVMKGGKVYKD